MDILKSAGEALSRISVIKTEVEMIPLYQNQALFGEVCAYLFDAHQMIVERRIPKQVRRVD